MDSITCLSFLLVIHLDFLSWSDSPQLWILHREPILCLGICHSPLAFVLSSLLIRLCLSLPTPGFGNARLPQHSVSPAFTPQTFLLWIHALYWLLFSVVWPKTWQAAPWGRQDFLGLWFKGTQSVVVGKAWQQAAPAGIWDSSPHHHLKKHEAETGPEAGLSYNPYTGLLQPCPMSLKIYSRPKHCHQLGIKCSYRYL